MLDNGSVLLVLVAHDRIVHALTWRGYPEERPDGRWEEAGTIDSLFESHAYETGRDFRRT